MSKKFWRKTIENAFKRKNWEIQYVKVVLISLLEIILYQKVVEIISSQVVVIQEVFSSGVSKLNYQLMNTKQRD